MLELIKDKDFNLRKAKKTSKEQDLIKARRIRNYCTKKLRTKNMLKKVKDVDLDLKLDGLILDRVHFYNYLGLTIDDQLNCNKHIQELNKIVSHKLSMFAKRRFYIDEKEAIALFKTMILPLIEYCDIIYEGTSVKNINTIYKLFKQGLGACIRNRNSIVTDDLELKKNCKICNLKIGRQVHLRNFMYKQQNHIELINRRNIRTRLHDAIVFKLYKPSSEKSRQNVIYRGALEWNKLNKEQRLLANYKSF